MAANILTASGIVARARSLADLANSSFITYQDQLSSLNEAYGDVYEKLIEANDDYYAIDYTFTAANGTMVPNTAGDEYLFPLPSDFLKLRNLMYFDNMYWHPVDRFPIRMESRMPGRPMYRMKGTNLQVIGLASYPVNSFKMTYYPVAPAITMPDQTYSFGAALTTAQIAAITALDYTPVQHTTIYYVPSAATLYADSLTLNASNALLTAVSSAITNIEYYKGSLYYLQSGNIYSAPTNLQSTITPTAIVSTANIVNFTINNVSGVDYLYYWDGTNTNCCSLSGSGAAVVQNSFTNDYCFAQNLPAYLTSTGAVMFNGTTLATSASSYSMMTSDGTNLYVLEPISSTIHQLQLSNSTGTWVVALDTIVDTNVALMSPYAAAGQNELTGRIGVVTWDPYVQAFSAVVNTTFSYPYNAVNDIIAYQTGIDFARKQDNMSKIQALMERLKALWERYQSQVGRDDFEYEHISNYYAPDNRYW